MAENKYAKAVQTEDGKKMREEGRKWLERITNAEKLEDRWMKDADEAVRVYTAEGSSTSNMGQESRNYDFNILFSNVETIVPAIINSPPSPDIRRRFGDEDPVAKEYAEIVERAITVQVDDSQLQIELEACAQDAFLAGRGIVRLRFKSDIEGEPELEEIKKLAMDTDGGGSDSDISYAGSGASGGADGGEVSVDEDRSQGGYGDEKAKVQETVTNERITFEAVSWRDYRHGPAKRWEDRPWDAFRHSMPQEEVDKFQDTEMMSGQMTAEDRMEVGESDNDIVVWEIWCKEPKLVKFVDEATGAILKIVEDPLGLTNFFPIAKPVQPIEVTGRLMPINPFSIYRRLAEELDTVTKRIDVITKGMKVRGWYSGDATDLENVVQLGDNEFAPITNAEVWAAHGGIEKAIAFWPIERFATVLKELYVARDQSKQAIYEITGISDIVRGASKASETLGAQEIKTQWGSLRIQKAQRAMERCARDLFVMMSEIIPDKFTTETLEKMTSIQLKPTEQDLAPIPPPQMQEGMDPKQQQQAMQQHQQAQQAQQEKLAKMQALAQLMNDKQGAYYRVDVETDSTVRADLTRQKQEVSEFLAGSGAYFTAVGPLVQEGILPPDVAIEIYAANARMFNLGKATEDAIDSMITQARDKAKQPQQEKPDPAAIKAQADAQAQQQDMQITGLQAKVDMQQAEMDFSAQKQEIQGKIAIEEAKLEGIGRKADADANTAVMDQQIKRIDLDIKQIDLQIKDKDLQIKSKQVIMPAKPANQGKVA